MSRAIWYVAHPVHGDVMGNVARAGAWLRWLVAGEPDVAFIAPWIASIHCGADDDNDPAQRARGILDAATVIARCDGIILCGGRVSDGMKIELEAMAAAGGWVLNLNEMGSEPPVTPAGPRLPERYRTRRT